MAQDSPAQKPKWGVGSFFQQAVAGVESRLDHILMDEEGNQTNQNEKPTETQIKDTPASTVPATSISRSSSSAKRNDRLQERLARAMMKQNASNLSSQASQSGSQSGDLSRPASPAQSNGDRSSIDINSSTASVASELEDAKPALANEENIPPRMSYDSGVSPRGSVDIAITKPLPKTSVTEARPSLDSEYIKKDIPDLQAHEASNALAPGDGPPASVEVANTSENQSPETADHKAAESQWQEERHGYIELIDALQSKLKYLAKDAAESAKTAAASAPPGSHQKKLLEKDEKIALLLEEGQKLSKSEMDHRTAIKKLRQQLLESTKSQTELKKKLERLEEDLVNSNGRAKQAEASEKKINDVLSSHTKSVKSLEAVTNERNALSQTIQEMKLQLSRAISRAEAAESKANSDALEMEKQRVQALESELSSLKTEHQISQNKAKEQISQLQEKAAQHEKEARTLEAEFKDEQYALESKMEGLRTRAEEASSGAAGEGQTKLLRQIETLQTQYAAASENWHTLEGSFLARLANVERERDVSGQREVDLRKKLREMNNKLKTVEDTVNKAQETESDLKTQLEKRMQELEKLQQKLVKSTEELTSTQKDMAEQKKTIDMKWAQKLEDERAKWRDQVQVSSSPQTRGMSPVASPRRSSTLDALSPGLSELRPSSRRSSGVPFASLEISTPPRQNSYPASVTQATLSPPLLNANPPIMEAPSISFEPDEYFGDSGTPATPSAYGGTQAPPRGINDIISENTVGAGPSVQLVERLSASIRRLESERAGIKDELARVTTQRDETRQQVVELMRELDEGQQSASRVKHLENELADLDKRHQTTLEMLGEESEQVNELKADIADLKKIYRELVDSTMK